MKTNNVTVTSEQVFNSLSEWYHPEIDYWEMLHKLRFTKDPLKEAIGHNTYPQDHVTLMFHAKAFGYDPDKKQEYPSKQQTFQFWNKQFNNALHETLKKLNPKLILDVGAGDGLLSKVLKDRGFNVIAIDNYEWPFDKRFFPVEELSYGIAIRKYQPDVVICSWMPLNTDWTPGFRRAKSVKHYITIGEVEAACGGDWEEKDGWEMHELEEASRFALCRTDDLWWKENGELDDHFMMHHSSVYLFSRKT